MERFEMFKRKYPVILQTIFEVNFQDRVHHGESFLSLLLIELVRGQPIRLVLMYSVGIELSQRECESTSWLNSSSGAHAADNMLGV